MSLTELRCKVCKALLGKEERDGLTIQRGGMQATFPDARTVVIVCYRCGQANVFKLVAASRRGDAEGGGDP